MSDEQLAVLHAEAENALKSSPSFFMRNLHVETKGESLVLTGRVPTFYQKQLAQELIKSVAADCELVNSIDVD